MRGDGQGRLLTWLHKQEGGGASLIGRSCVSKFTWVPGPCAQLHTEGIFIFGSIRGSRCLERGILEGRGPGGCHSSDPQEWCVSVARYVEMGWCHVWAGCMVQWSGARGRQWSYGWTVAWLQERGHAGAEDRAGLSVWGHDPGRGMFPSAPGSQNW